MALVVPERPSRPPEAATVGIAPPRSLPLGNPMERPFGEAAYLLTVLLMSWGKEKEGKEAQWGLFSKMP